VEAGEEEEGCGKSDSACMSGGDGRASKMDVERQYWTKRRRAPLSVSCALYDGS
jgi:hypothetical protein